MGGALIAASALGAFTAHRTTGTAPTAKYIVAIRSIPAGSIVETADLGSMSLDLPEDVAAFRSEDAHLVTGRVAAGNIGKLELLSDEDLLDDDHFIRPGATTMSIDLPPARAMSGVIAAGDVVSVLSTDPQGTGTERLTSTALVVSTSNSSSESIGSSGAVRIVLSVDDAAEAVAITDASITSELSLVLVTSSNADSNDSPARPADTP